MSNHNQPGTAGTRTVWYTHEGQQVTARQLATLAGCGYQTMFHRLTRHEPAEAVAMGAGSRSANARTAHLEKYKFKPSLKTKAVRLAPEPKAKPVKAGRTREAKCPVERVDDFQRKVKAGSKLEKVLMWRGQVLQAGKEFIPDDVKRTVAPTPPDRFAVQPGGTFGRIGQYGETSAWAQAATEGRP